MASLYSYENEPASLYSSSMSCWLIMIEEVRWPASHPLHTSLKHDLLIGHFFIKDIIVGVKARKEEEERRKHLLIDNLISKTDCCFVSFFYCNVMQRE